ncbi:MAG: D-sedoheptulose 7-phosphate isomerase [Saprospiraceae bacterium]|nr:D-sedoheptulose 7-phosphate isomerase [Candidatus Vicinibacter proximus]MBL7822466.1 D-sedoheptulose 7-phosphate isomerase [Saprospiraceae bacterium]MCC6843209.1 D-sedoheptulose 7-phosphate isomerase [Saprospiraceae bacterium]HRG33037.1 D-sedoheptulose 7-phosphate isomerase [Saprospiraceae bacterium]
MKQIKNIISDSIKVKQLLLEDEKTLTKILEASHKILHSLQNGGRIYFCGNGGSAADAQHLAAEFSGRFYQDRKALPAEALHTNTSYLTAVANDYSYDVVYSRLIHGVGHPQDVLIGISTSGNSKNIVLALEEAKKIGMATIGLTGSKGGIMKDICDINLAMPSEDTPRIQECHIMIGHIICQMVEDMYFQS